jgi:hypothetical protein
MIATFADNKQVGYRLSRDGMYCVVNPDYDQRWGVEFVKNWRVSRPTRNGTPYSDNVPSSKGLPATARFVDDTPVKFFRDLQFWVHGLCSENAQQSEALNKKDFASMWRDNAWMSNFAGTWTRADYINNNGKPPEIQLQPMACGGSLLKIVGESTVRQTPCWVVEAINPNFSYRGYHPDTHKHLFFRPILSVREWLKDLKGNVTQKNEFYAEPFDDYGENSVVPVFGFRYDVRSSTKYTNVIEKYRVKLLGDSPVPNPFIMRYGRKKANPYEGF